MTATTEISATDITTVIGTASEGRKVHMAFRRDGKLFCQFTPTGARIDKAIADLPDDGGMNETIAVLDEHRIAVSRLCAHCFTTRFRHTLAARRRKTSAS